MVRSQSVQRTVLGVHGCARFAHFVAADIRQEGALIGVGQTEVDGVVPGLQAERGFAPGHVGLVIGKNTMIEAYAAGTPVRVSTFGTAQSPPGDGTVVGDAQPWPNNDNNATVGG